MPSHSDDIPGDDASPYEHDDLTDRFDEALALFDDDRLAEAEAAFTRIIQAFPDAAEAYGNRGLIRMHAGDEEAAIEDFRRVLLLAPEDAHAHAALADVHRFREPERSLAHAAAALELDADEVLALWVRGWLLARAGQYAAAREDLDRHLELQFRAERENAVPCDDPDCPDCRPGDGGRDGNGEAEAMAESLRRHAPVVELRELCRILSEWEARGTCPEGPFEEVGERRLSSHGWSFDLRPRAPWSGESAAPACRWGHCAWNLQERSKTAPGGCPWLGRRCPGGPGQVAHCRIHCDETGFPEIGDESDGEVEDG